MNEPPLLSNLTDAAIELARRNDILADKVKRVGWAVRDRDKAREHAAEAEMMLAEMVSRCIPELRHTMGDTLAAERLRVIEAASYELSGGRDGHTILRDYLDKRPRRSR